jgi:hypothetical protein
LLVVGALVAFLVIKRKSWRLSRGQDPEQNEPLSPLASGLKRKSHGSHVFTLILLLLQERIASSSFLQAIVQLLSSV